MLLRLECVCHDCERTECYLTVVIEAEDGETYRPPRRCVAGDRKANWQIDRIGVEKLDDD
ncbi:hypothetical protein DRO97_02415 [Archaeoglobales archaeon]|nr:MAG: hypothetical protein DRO97_02415 [Archaeoglobales archaeon]